MTDTIHYCATLSSEADEPLYGSAPYKTRWLVLEYASTWGAEAFAESELPPPVKSYLKTFLDQTPAANLLFIRQSGRRADYLAFYMAEVNPAMPRLYAWQLEHYEDLLDIDLNTPDETNRSEESLCLVCTNAKRDACCATYGAPVYRALREHLGNQVWQSTHLGGHRFAATALFLPSGINYGRLRPADVPHMVEQHRSGNIVLDKLRGRVCYDKPVQAGEYHLRKQLGLPGTQDLTLDTIEQPAPDLWDMSFRVNSHTEKIRLERVRTDKEIYTSCSNDKRAFVEDYRLIRT
jgi:hypothetical protein